MAPVAKVCGLSYAFAYAIQVADNGRGFEAPGVLKAEEGVGVEGGHFGLRGIQDRVAMLGGTFALDSTPGQGTVLTLSLPRAPPR